ncbi:MAG TPA: hypothetical protein PK239_16120 [Chitinophagales bacterium]|nr:hypothetical protein [Chitinophagales bacterium]HRK28801.1 hypothetical protein [Chitinophagales bacterium]
MKQLLIALCIVCFSAQVFAQDKTAKESYKDYSYITLKPADSEYFQNMKQAIDIMDRAMEKGQMEQAINFFTEISEEEPKEWLPSYYAAYCYATLCFMERDRLLRDRYLNEAQAHLDRIMKIQPNNAEILVLQAYVYQQRVEVDPTSRVQDYGTMVQINLDDAAKLEPDNPRLHFLLAQTTFFAPESAGGGMINACPMVHTAAKKYEENPPLNDIAPKWGGAIVSYMQTICESLNR